MIVNHATMLRESGFDVEVLTCHYDKETLKKMEFGDIKVTNISKIKTKNELVNLILCFLGFNRLKEYNPNLFLSYSFPSNYLIKNKKTKKANYISHFPHFLYLRDDKKKEWASGTKGLKRWLTVIFSWFLKSYLKRLDRRMISKNELIYMNSKFTKKRLDKMYKRYYKNGDSVVSYPPLDPKFKPSKKKMKEKFIFSSSRIIPDKRYELLIEACSHMKKKLPVYISGQGNEEYQKKLEELAKIRGIKLKFLGRLTTEDLLAHYTNASVFAFPTLGEDFGLVPAESMACGTPVVVWGDGAGPTEQVIDGVTGYHAKPIDVKDYAKKMDRVIDTKMKTKNRKKILDNASRFYIAHIKGEFMKEINKIV